MRWSRGTNWNAKGPSRKSQLLSTILVTINSYCHWLSCSCRTCTGSKQFSACRYTQPRGSYAQTGMSGGRWQHSGRGQGRSTPRQHPYHTKFSALSRCNAAHAFTGYIRAKATCMWLPVSIWPWPVYCWRCLEAANAGAVASCSVDRLQATCLITRWEQRIRGRVCKAS